jgi:hypothetical protein
LFKYGNYGFSFGIFGLAEVKERTDKKILFGIICLTAVVSAFASYSLTTLFVAPAFVRQGYESGLTDMQKALDQAGVFTNWQLNGNGGYTITVLGNSGMEWQFNMRFDMVVQQYRDGKLISQALHAMTVTNFGKDWVEQQLFSDVNYTDNALYISTSNDETSVSAAWVVLPNEVTTNGVERDAGSYSSTGVGAANVTKTFSVSGTQSTCLYGINAGPNATYANSLIAAEQQGSGSRKNLVSGDTLAVTVVWSHS